MKKGLSARFLCALSVFGLVGQIAWVVENMYLNVFMYKMFGASAEDISLMVSASAVTAALTTVFIGALADKLGKRRVFISGGYVLWGISILGFTLVRREVIGALFPTAASWAAIGVSAVIILDCLMTFFGSSANDAAFNAWLTDSVENDERGRAEGINAVMPLVAILAVFGGFMAFDLGKSDSWTLIFLIIGVAVIGVGILGLFIINEPSIEPSREPYLRTVIHGFLPRVIRENKGLYLYLALFIIFNTSIQIFMPYLILYYEVSLGMADYVLIMAPAIVLASVFTVFWGKAYDRLGFGLTAWVSLGALSVGYVLLFFFTGTALVFIGSLLMMCGYLSGMAVFGASIRERIPEGRAGMFQGVRIFSQVLVPGVVGPLIGRAVLKNAKTVVGSDGVESFIPSAGIFLAALAAAAVLAAALVAVRVVRKK